MGTKFGLRGWLLLGVIVLLPAGARGQDAASSNADALDGALPYPLMPVTVRAQTWTPEYAPEDPQSPLPNGSTRPESGFYFGSEFIFWRQTRPIKDQLLAVRGFFDVDGEVTGVPGTFVGSGAPALFANNLGTRNYQPGFEMVLGWRFKEGVAVDFDWYHLFEVKYAGGATLIPSLYQGEGQSLENTFLTSFVYNYTPDWAGAAGKVTTSIFGASLPAANMAVYGIWNGATIMDIAFFQRYDQYDLKARIPLFETDWNRTYGLVGGRFAWIWEKFRWMANDYTGPADEADYDNVISNRMYGPFIGCGDECRLGDTPIGTFALSLDCTAAALLDVVKTREIYMRGDRYTSSRNDNTEYEVVPEVGASINLWWYPASLEGVELRIGYDMFAFFNTIGSPYPVAFNLAAPETQWQAGIFRFFDGFHTGVSISF